LHTISFFLKECQGKVDFLDLELILSYVLKKPREFVLAHPEHKIPESRNAKLEALIKRRLKHEPLAYILGEKEFYGLKFKVNRNTLIPRPETEMLVEEVLKEIKAKSYIVDIGTGSGNIIIAIAKNFQFPISNFQLLGTDISKEALKIAKQNAKLNKVDKYIKFLHGNLLDPIIKKCSMFHAPCSMIIIANLPYLSQKIYNSSPKDVKNFEPKKALFSKDEGLKHYKDMLKQIKNLAAKSYKLTAILEISPEQKPLISKFIKELFPKAKPEFKKDLAGKWRVMELEIN
jgi:release factor glutamine methyltransferase